MRRFCRHILLTLAALALFLGAAYADTTLHATLGATYANGWATITPIPAPGTSPGVVTLATLNQDGDLSVNVQTGSYYQIELCTSAGTTCVNFLVHATVANGYQDVNTAAQNPYVTPSGSYTWTGAQTLQGNALTFFKPSQYSSGLFSTLSANLTGNSTGTSPVNFNWQEYGFTNTGDATRDDNVFRMGWNIAPGGGPSVATQASTMFEMEDYYFPTGTSCGATGAQDESHWGYIDTSGALHRLLSWCGKTGQDLSQISITFGSVANSQFAIASGSTTLWQFFPSGVINCNFCTGSTDTALFEIPDAAGNDVIEHLGSASAWQLSTGNQATNYYFYPTVGFWNNNNQTLGYSSKHWGGLYLTAGAFSSLPACGASEEGDQRAVNDSTTATWGATITGSGSNHVLAYCDGTNWTVAAK